MDPLTAFAAAGNVLQFVQLGASLVGKFIEYTADGGNSEYERLQPIVQQLLVSNAHLGDILAQNTVAPTRTPGPARAVQLANQQCLEISRDFIDFLNRSKLTKPGLSWRNVRSALIAMKHKSTVKTYQSRISEARSNLTLSILVYVVSRSRSGDSLTSAEDCILSDLRNTENVSPAVASSVGDLVQKFARHHIDVRSDQSSMDSVLRKQAAPLSNLSRRLHQWLGKQPEQAAKVSEHLKHLQTVHERENRARQKLVESLSFAEMEERRRQIIDAHKETFQWILQRDSGNVAVWDSFLQWLDGDGSRNLYWVRGKPGSGKSTLMRFLDNNIEKQTKSTLSFTQGQFLKASCYFWYAGSPLQKSLVGLLQSLLYQIYKVRPDLVDRTVPKRRWEDACASVDSVKPWQVDDLKDALRFVATETLDESKVFFLVDGLDEYEGTDDEREEMVHLFEQLTQGQHVKACLSSRPWNIYKDLFISGPQLKLEDLTRDDIRKFLHDSLQDHMHFVRLQRRRPDLLEKVAEEILQRANGVFLWVRLVLRHLLKVLRDGGRTSELMDELRSIPDDLDGFFMRMMDGIDNRYKMDASMIMQVALCDLDYTVPNDDEAELPEPGPQLELNDLYYLSEKSLPDFSLQPDLTFLDHIDRDELHDIQEDLDRRLTSRCMGLLEVSSEHHVTFLHRTVRDFLTTSNAQQIFHRYTGGKTFDARRFRFNVLLVRLLGIMKTEAAWSQRTIDWLSCLLHHLMLKIEWDDSIPALFDTLVSSLNLRRKVELLDWQSLEACLNEWRNRKTKPLAFAIQLGFKAYVVTRYQQLKQGKFPRPLLDYALRPCHGSPQHPNVALTSQILAWGADPNSIFAGASILCRFVVTLAFLPRARKSDCMTIFRLLMDHGAHPYLEIVEINAAHELLARSGEIELGEYRVEEDSPLLRRIVKTCTIIDLSQGSGFKSPSEGPIAAYRIFDVLRCICCWPGVVLFDDDDIRELQHKHELYKMTTGAVSSEVDDSAKYGVIDGKAEGSTWTGGATINSDREVTTEAKSETKTAALKARVSFGKIVLSDC